jgi:integrase
MTGEGVWRGIASACEADWLRFIALTGCRSSEAAELPWAEIDLDQRVWTLSAERSKNKREHMVPLTDELMDLLTNRLPQGGDYVFAGTTAPHLYASRLCVVCKRLCKRVRRIGFQEFTPHDLRRTVETGMAAARVPREYRDRVLNHVDPSVGAVHYNVYDYVDEKRQALALWAKRVREFI